MRPEIVEVPTLFEFEMAPDDKRRLVGLHLLNELLAPTRRENVMIIMAGGQGLRLRPYTENCPKPLLHVNGKPMLEHSASRSYLRKKTRTSYAGSMP